MRYFFLFSFSLLVLSLSPSLSGASGIREAISVKWHEGDGLRAFYFNGTNFKKRVYSRIDEEIDFYYHRNSPAPGVNRENYSICWTGNLYAPVSGTYELSVRVDDGIRLWLNGVKILDKWKSAKAATYTGQMQLTEGEFYSIRIEYYNSKNEGIMQLMWKLPEDADRISGQLNHTSQRTIIPKRYLFTQLPEEKPALAQRNPERNRVSASTTATNTKRTTKKVYAVADKAEATDKLQIDRMSYNPSGESSSERLAEGSTFDDLKQGDVIRFRNVRFEQGKYTLLDGSSSELDKLARTLVKYPSLKIRIEGHTDNVGNPRINQSLSLFRAKVVATYLQDRGIALSRIEVKGYGSKQPLADNATEEGRARNRRVQFVVR